MRQQINLYQDVLIDRPEPLQSRQFVMLIIAALACLALLGGFSYWQLGAAEMQRDALRQEVEVTGQRVAELEQLYPEKRKNALLEEKIKRLEGRIAGQREALVYFSEQDTESNAALLASLEGLAQSSVKGVWLNRVSLLQRGDNVSLAGTALAAELVPEYVGLISRDNVFGGRVFSLLKLDRLEKQGGRIDFKLKSEPGGNR